MDILSGWRYFSGRRLQFNFPTWWYNNDKSHILRRFPKRRPNPRFKHVHKQRNIQFLPNLLKISQHNGRPTSRSQHISLLPIRLSKSPKTKVTRSWLRLQPRNIFQTIHLNSIHIHSNTNENISEFPTHQNCPVHCSRCFDFE